ncbi:MAG TPA: tRNA 2-thiocytidine biosynthesis protein TtcA [Clostridiales bacterium]|nr:tRNA 2-thiocytidine biosynthesis protein TtcA [Clostridiales bacterium]
MERYEEIEKSLIKKYRKSIWNRFIMGMKEYQMVNEGDRIAVCISGGKDSMILAKCLQHLQAYSQVHFDLEYIVMDPGYNQLNRKKIEENAKLLNIPVKIFHTDIFNTVHNMGGSPCYVCARMRRGHLYKNAQLLGCNKIALGHHFDDVIETILMGMLYGGQVQTMMPKLHSTNYQGMELIRPLYMVKEQDIISWVNYNSLEFIQCACRFTEMYEKEHNAHDVLTSKRAEMKEMIKNFRTINPNIEHNIFNSVCNVNLDTIISYHKGDEYHSFIDEY